MSFLHGIEVIEVDSGARPLQAARSSVIGLVGTAASGTLNTPVLVSSLSEAVTLFGAESADYTLPTALKAIFDQARALVVVIRVTRVLDGQNYDEEATTANVIGGVDGQTGAYTGLSALLAAESVLGVAPKLIVTPGFSHTQSVADAMVAVADRLRGLAIADGPNSTDGAAITYRDLFSSARLYLVDPWAKRLVGSTPTILPVSAAVAGVIARSDEERGFWWSPSNRPIAGVLGTGRPVDFVLGDSASRANVLNENEVATIIQLDGFRLWGNRTCSDDVKWAFVSVRRTADMLNEAVLRSHLWAVDRNITRTYVQDVIEGVNAYLRSLQARGAILGGRCWADPDLNTPAAISNGEIYFDFDFTPPYPAEHITFRAHLVQDYISEVLP